MKPIAFAILTLFGLPLVRGQQIQGKVESGILRVTVRNTTSTPLKLTAMNPPLVNVLLAQKKSLSEKVESKRSETPRGYSFEMWEIPAGGEKVITMDLTTEFADQLNNLKEKTEFTVEGDVRVAQPSEIVVYPRGVSLEEVTAGTKDLEETSPDFRIPFSYTPPELRPENALPPLPLADAKKLEEKEVFNSELRPDEAMAAAMAKETRADLLADFRKPLIKASAAVIETSEGPALRLRLHNEQGFHTNAWQGNEDSMHTAEIPLKLEVNGVAARAYTELENGPEPNINRFTKPMLERFKPVDVVIPLSKRFVTEGIQPGSKVKLIGERRGIAVWYGKHRVMTSVPFELEFTWTGK